MRKLATQDLSAAHLFLAPELIGRTRPAPGLTPAPPAPPGAYSSRPSSLLASGLALSCFMPCAWDGGPGSGDRGQGAGCWVQGSGFRAPLPAPPGAYSSRPSSLSFPSGFAPFCFMPCAWDRVQGPGFRVQGPGFRVQGSGFRVQGSGSRVQGSGSRVLDLMPPRRARI